MKTKNIGLILFISLVIKLFLAVLIPVFGDESYYWFWGQHVQLSYFDHPAMVGWLTWLGSQLDFLPKSLIVRWPFVILSTISLFVFIKIIDRTIKNDSKISGWLVVFYLLNPMLGFGGILATPDVPLIFFWSLSYLFVLRILEKQNIKDYILLGACLGLGFCSKYHIVLFPLTIGLGVVWSKKYSEINLKKLIFTIFAGILFSSPVLIWNYQNEWASIAFQLSHGFQGRLYTPLWTITYIVGQVFLFNPFLMYQLIFKTKNLFPKNTAFFQWSFFLLSSFKAGVEANWPVTAHLQGLSSLQPENNFRFFKYALSYALLLWIAFFGFYFSEFGQEKIKKIPNMTIAEKIWPQIESYKPLYGPTYQISSLLQLFSNKEVLKLNELSRTDFYDSAIFQRPTQKVFYSLKYDISDWPDWLNLAQKTAVLKFPEYNLVLYRIDNE